MKIHHLVLLFSLSMPLHAVVADDNTMEKEVTCLAQNIYYEAGAEPRQGKIAVGQVVMNRTKHENFPSTACGVVHQKTKKNSRTICQFSWVCQKVRSAIKRDSDTWQESKEIAQTLLQSGKIAGTIQKKSALYFHATYVRPDWASKMRYVAKIGNHVFYSEPGYRS